MVYVKIIVRVLSFVIVTAAFLGVPLCWVGVKLQGLMWGALLTFLLGRFFCSSICPLGILQSLVNGVFHPKAHVRRVCTRLPETVVQRVVRWSVVAMLGILAAVGVTGAMTCLFPISIFGKAVAVLRAVATKGSWAAAFGTPEAQFFAVFSVAGLLLVLTLSACGRGRVWCNWICPFGTVFALVSRFSLRKDKVEKRCRACGKCFAKAAEAKPAKEESAAATHGCERREVLKGVAVLAVADKLTDGGYAGVSLPGSPERKVAVLPPGAGTDRAFHLKCVACQLCVANCPGECLKPSVRLSSFGQPELDFRRGSCIATCVKCGEICPEGAILKLQDIQRKNVHVGRAVWAKDLCIRTTEQTECTACSRKCPVQAIHIVKGFPVVDEAVCIGCGACEHVCPARPMPAIHVEGYEEQRVVLPMTPEEARAEAAEPVDRYAATC